MPERRDVTDEWDLAGYVESSQYRRAVVEQLRERDTAVPSTIAEATGYALPHVSRALSELRNREVVELLVSEDRHRGRVYALTDRGRAVGARLARNGVDYDVVDASSFPHESLLRFLDARVTDGLRAVASRTGRTAAVVERRPLSRPWALLEYPDPDRADADRRFAVRGFEDETVVLLLAGADADVVGVSVDAGTAVDLPGFVRRCSDHI
jgi:DNA-binding MarR family transcriptional regulator